MNQRLARAKELIPRPIQIILALLPIVTVLAATARTVKSAADSTYLSRDTFALVHQRDSLNLKSEIQALRADVAALLRACQKRGECP